MRSRTAWKPSEKAHDLLPNDPDILADWVLALAHAGRSDEARHLADERLAPLASEELVAQTDRFLLEEELRRVTREVAAGELETAEEILRRAIDRNATADGIIPAEQRRSLREVPIQQRAANPGAADTAVGDLDGRGALDAEPALFPGNPELIKIAFALGAEAEVVTYREMLNAQTIHEHALDECLGRHGGERRPETQAEHTIDATITHRVKLLAQTCEPRGRTIRRKELSGLRLEDDSDLRHAERAAPSLEAGENSLVPKVHAIEIPNGRGATPMPGTQIV